MNLLVHTKRRLPHTDFCTAIHNAKLNSNAYMSSQFWCTPPMSTTWISTRLFTFLKAPLTTKLVEVSVSGVYPSKINLPFSNVPQIRLAVQCHSLRQPLDVQSTLLPQAMTVHKEKGRLHWCSFIKFSTRFEIQPQTRFPCVLECN